jgi:hypothetical protein
MTLRRQLTSLLAVALVCCVASTAATAAPRKVQAPEWRTWWGNVDFGRTGVTLWSRVPKVPSMTHSALVTSKATWGDHVFTFSAATLRQLRAGTAPNVWEVAWVMFRFRDLENYYYFMVKPNGIELGKKHGSDAQIFLATADAPNLVFGRNDQYRVHVQGPRIRISVNGEQVIDYTDRKPLPAGSIGLYEEDAKVRFGPVSVTAL